MAAPAMDRPGIPSRTASLQRMLDLEQKYRMARISGDHASPMSSFASEPFLPLDSQTKQPLQARRRNPREQLVQSTSDLTLQSPRRNQFGAPLSITIPSTTSPEDDRAPETDKSTPRVGEATPGKTVTFFEAGDDDDDQEFDEDDDDGKSVQSSICHSPSWENYGQKKKDKKAKAEKKRQEKAKADQELKSAKKRLANRLAKMPPASATTSNTPVATTPTSAVAPGKLSRGLSAPLIRFGSQSANPSSQPNKLEKPAPQKTGSSWGFASFASGLVANATTPLPPHATKAIAAKEQAKSGAKAPEARQEQPGTTALRNASKQDNRVDARSSGAQGIQSKSIPQKAQTIAAGEQENRETAPINKDHRVMTMPEPTSNGISYPPPASRSHALRQAPGNSHARVNSTTAIVPPKADESTKFSKAQNMRSSQNSKLYGAGNVSEVSLQSNSMANDRARQRSSSSNSYVRRSRDQSTDRSLAGLSDEIAVSEACGPQQPSKRTSRLTSFLKHKTGDNGKAGLLATEPHTSQATDAEASGKQDEHQDYFNFVNGTYNPPALELATPAPGLLSSFRSMMSRRSSASSGQGMQLPVSAHSSSHLLTKPHPEHGGQRPTAPSRAPQSATSVNRVPEAVVLPPKAARVLGEYHPTTIGSQAPPPGSRPSEGSSMSSYNEDSSVPPSPASTPDTSRPQSTKGAGSSVDNEHIGHLDISLPREETTSLSTARYYGASGAAISSSRSSSKAGREPYQFHFPERPPSRGRVLENLERPPSRGRLLQLDRRPLSKSRAYEDLRPTVHPEETLPMPGDDRWCRTAMPLDIDAQSFVTSLTNLDDTDLALPQAVDEKTASWGFLDGDSRPGTSHSQMDGCITGKERERASSSDSRRRQPFAPQAKTMPKEQEYTMTTCQHANVVMMNGEHHGHLIAEAAQNETSFMPPIKQQLVIPPKSKARMAAPLSAPLPVQEPPRPSAQSTASSSSSGSTSSAAYLHEARRSAPLIPSLLSNNSRPKATEAPAPTAVAVTGPRPALAPASSAPASVPRQQLLKAATTSTPIASSASFRASAPDLVAPSHTQAHPHNHNHIANANNTQTGKPVAKMLVECCSCKFFHDMPSRVYECMAQPDAVVTDRALGVSGAITTMVKCPWCAHNMSTKCCAGYAAVVYLKERMH